MWCDRSRIDLFIYLMIYLLNDVIFALLLYNYSYISFQTFASIMFYYLHNPIRYNTKGQVCPERNLFFLRLATSYYTSRCVCVCEIFQKLLFSILWITHPCKESADKPHRSNLLSFIIHTTFCRWSFTGFGFWRYRSPQIHFSTWSVTVRVTSRSGVLQLVSCGRTITIVFQMHLKWNLLF